MSLNDVPMTPVQSSNIAAVGFDPVARFIMVQFKDGSRWMYHHATPEDYEGLVGAPSVGKYFAANIKGRLPGERM